MQKIALEKKLGFEGVQFHDDDAVENRCPSEQIAREAREMKQLLDGEGLGRIRRGCGNTRGRLTEATPPTILKCGLRHRAQPPGR